jgi:hypothetical protein
MPWFEVSPEATVIDPNFGDMRFNISVDIRNLDTSLHAVGFKFDLGFDSTLAKVLNVEEGNFVRGFSTNEYGTLFTSFIHENASYAKISVEEGLLSNTSGLWNNFPEGNGTIACIRFIALDRNFSQSHFGDFVLSNAVLSDENDAEIPIGAPENGSLEILTATAGTWIDLYGGAVNRGYGYLDTHGQFVLPYGGQGPNAPMDLVEPQSWVWLHANVTYNYWPANATLIGFEIIEPNGAEYARLFAFTDANGSATVGFGMPWPVENPESLFGVWHVVASVQLANEYINDTMDFHYDYLVQIFKVTTNKYEYNHDETVEAFVTFGSHAQQNYPILLKVHIADELGVIIGHFEIATSFGGAVYCQYRNATLCGFNWIPKWAYAGIATVHVNIFDQEPIFGGAPWTPEYTPPPTIAIQPY